MINIFLRNFIISLLVLAGSSSELMASKRILVDLTRQIAIAYQDGKVKFYGRISSGKPGRETPTGSYYVREKDIDHVSNLWPKPNGGAHMPYMLRITHDGVAMHLGPTPDHPASHGCIRMRSGFAQRMYRWADKYIRVDIVGRAPAHSPRLALPAYAKSKSILRKSVGSQMGTAANMLSTNPKDHQLPYVPTSSHSSKPARHMNAIAMIGTNPKHHKAVRSSVKKHSYRSHRRKKKHQRHERHPRPLKMVGGR